MAVAAKNLRTELDQRAWDSVCDVPDPEVPVLTIEDLGVLRDVHVREDGCVEVTITPTYTGCPAMSMFAFDIEAALLNAGFDKVEIKTVLTPAWTTDWLSEKAREKLRVYGIAPPNGKASRRALFGRIKPLPKVQLCQHQPYFRVWLNRLQGAVPLQRLF